MSAEEKILCAVHGKQTRTYVCQHVYEGLVARKRVGFFWTAENPGDPRPDAYCRECEVRVRNTGGEWIGDALENLQPKVLCGSCYDLAKSFHMGGNPWS
jgi:hypothetical protein